MKRNRGRPPLKITKKERLVRRLEQERRASARHREKEKAAVELRMIKVGVAALESAQIADAQPQQIVAAVYSAMRLAAPRGGRRGSPKAKKKALALQRGDPSLAVPG
jgi:hypothetical protein